MGKWTKGKLAVSKSTHNFTGTLVNWIEINNKNFARTTASDQEFTAKEVQEKCERLVSCWNACEKLDNPESDLNKIIEALKAIDFIASDEPSILLKNIKAISKESLSLIKEE